MSIIDLIAQLEYIKRFWTHFICIFSSSYEPPKDNQNKEKSQSNLLLRSDNIL